MLAACATHAPSHPVDLSPLPGLDTPYQTPEDVCSHFRLLEQTFADRHDERGPHITSYLVATRAVMRHLDCGFFKDDDWIRSAIVCYGNHFRQALQHYEQGERSAVPRIWLIAHDAPRSRRALLHQDLLLGIVAHIRDLTFTLAEVGVEPLAVRRHDYFAVNRILRRAIDPMQRRLCCIYASGFGVSDLLGGFLDETLGVAWVEAMREEGWAQGLRLARAGSSAEREAAARAIDATALRHARKILAFPTWGRALEGHRRRWLPPSPAAPSAK